MILLNTLCEVFQRVSSNYQVVIKFDDELHLKFYEMKNLITKVWSGVE